ncbi:MAG: phosphate acyltransferase PlsX [Oscillospiraceae bacterium]|nr:phosphate acyltransferase PlsX [Oscillospiraceae bacterium]
MRIILDAMGGDLAPLAPVMGAVEAAKLYNAQITLVGRGEEILDALKSQGIVDLPAGLQIANADDVVDMHDDPAKVIHKKKNSSMIVGLKMLADGEGDAFISAGSTGALLTGATLIVKRVKGIRRAAMGPAMPNKTGGKTVLLDCGANAECTPEFLLQFGVVGSLYAKKYLGIENPKVGLLNIGTEDSKGTALQKEAYALLTNAAEQGILNFVGNVEARDVPLGAVDVVVCDGFSGNILLKSIEGTAMFMGSLMKRMFKKNLLTKLGALFCMSGVKKIKKLMDYREIGGTPFLGIRKMVIKAHGASDALAFRNAVKQAMDSAESNIAEDLEQELSHLTAKENDDD